MSQNKSNLSYDSLSLKLFRALVRLQNKFSKWRRNKTIARWNCRSKEANLEVFDRFKALIPEIAGYNQEGTFEQLQVRAYKRKARSFLDYYETVVKDKDELSFLRENLTYTGSHFFRGDDWARVADLCREKIANSNQDKFHIWCAACANGKEVYSILMTALDVASFEKLDILATDYNEAGIAQCLAGSYPLRTMDEIPERYRRYTTIFKASKTRDLDFAYRYQFQFCQELRNLIRGKRLNLLTDEYPTGLDLILCRNVIKFFATKNQIETWRKLAQSLNDDGLLVLSEAEVVADPESIGLTRIDDTCVYRKHI